MDSRNTKVWLAGGGVLSAATLAVSGTLTALVDVNGLFRLLDVADLWPF